MFFHRSHRSSKSASRKRRRTHGQLTNKRTPRRVLFEQLEDRRLLAVYTSGDVPQAIPDQGTVLSTLEIPDSVTIADLKGLEVSGPGDVSVTGLDNKVLKVELDGSADIRLFGRTEALDIKISGAGDVIAKEMDNKVTTLEIDGAADVRLYGKTTALDIKINGSADVYASQLQAQDAVVSIEGSADVRVHVIETLDVKITGSGDVVYRGTAKVRAKVTGSGNVTRAITQCR